MDRVSEDRAALETELRDRYGARYRVIASSSAAAALAELEAMRASGADVALLIAAEALPDMSGLEFLERARALQRNARRVLLVQRPFWSRGTALREALAQGRIDNFITRPWPTPDPYDSRGALGSLHPCLAACERVPGSS